jgi:hypothetical protein
MVLPCWTVSHLAIAPKVHQAVHFVRKVIPNTGHRLVHHVRHVYHAAATHPAMWVDTACRVAPGVLLAGLLGVAPAAMPPQAMVVQPSIAADRTLPPGIDAFGPAAIPQQLWMGGPGVTGSGSAGVAPGFTLVTMPTGQAPIDTPASPNLAPYLAPNTDAGSQPPGPGQPGLSYPSGSTPPQLLPEPSSFVLFAVALCGFGLLVRASNRRRRGSRTLSCEIAPKVD